MLTEGGYACTEQIVCHVSLVTRDPALALRASRVAAAPAHPDPLRRLPLLCRMLRVRLSTRRLRAVMGFPQFAVVTAWATGCRVHAIAPCLAVCQAAPRSRRPCNPTRASHAIAMAEAISPPHPGPCLPTMVPKPTGRALPTPGGVLPRSSSFARAIRGISHALRASAIAWAAEEARRARGRGVALLQDICTQRGSTDAAGAVGAARRREPMPEQGLHGTMTRHGAASLMTTSRLSIASRGTKGEGVTACDHCNLLQAARDCASAISTIDARTTIALEDGFCT